jgi:DNA-binding protein HU-beta
MNMSELTKSVASSTGATETATKAMIAAVFDAIAASAAEGDDVAIPGFGKFTVKSRPERQGRNPATGEAMTIKASRKVSFAAAKGLKCQPARKVDPLSACNIDPS